MIGGVVVGEGISIEGFGGEEVVWGYAGSCLLAERAAAHAESALKTVAVARAGRRRGRPGAEHRDRA